MIAVIRSLLFNIFYVLWTLILGILYLPFLVLPPSSFGGLIRFWLRGLVWGARLLCGIRWKIEGLENLPHGACIIAAKHQSAWETLFFHLLLSDPVYALKKELLSIPLVGWYMHKARMITIDRKAGASALRTLLREADPVFQKGRQLIIFPEGTRVAPGQHKPWQPGIAALYGRYGDQIPVIPVALNSGLLWGRNSFVKKSGVITVRILPPVPTGLGKKDVVAHLQTAINDATDSLCGSEASASESQP